MARPFSAPMPVYRNFRLPRDVRDADTETLLFALGWRVGADAEWRDLWAQVFWLRTYGPGSPDLKMIDPYLKPLTQAWRLGDLILAVRDVALDVGKIEDALAVDDHFIAYIDPDSAEAHKTEFLKLVAEAEQQGVPRARIEATSMETPPCLHSKNHAALLAGRRGPKRRSSRRAATWGTYIAAWLIGSEGMAVRLWNMLVPASYRWGRDLVTPEYSLKKYVTAKGRLVEDLMRWCPRRIVNPNGDLRPYPPLDPDVALTLEGLIHRYAQAEALGVDLSDYQKRVALVLPPPSAFGLPWPAHREGDLPEQEEDSHDTQER